MAGSAGPPRRACLGGVRATGIGKPRGLLLALALCVAASALVELAWLGPLGAAPPTSEGGEAGRRRFLAGAAAGALPLLAGAGPAAAGGNREPLLDELRKDRQLIEPLQKMVLAEKWDGIRKVLAKQPVGALWRQGLGKSPVKALGEEVGDPDIFELGEDMATALQLTDQFSYDNAFIPTQPGNGKVMIEEPVEQLKKALKNLDKIIEVGSSS
eukprot:CAMPEP_0203926672 /NCGR_PEP_ID=MMETSP0359-20131031/66172_1 /ASSEMBLY_ACC=CAM_ASM_000338 /TAXON_ID=268821 /ORGANISM="Scrippsiella Hangoei, Strain SHTV-5" /LENGTH=212 /DNA_ID=CAMNT_0050855315 /DNA_START=12 /DNA_END=650 /DNA_ORIENTATION=-